MTQEEFDSYYEALASLYASRSKQGDSGLLVTESALMLLSIGVALSDVQKLLERLVNSQPLTRSTDEQDRGDKPLHGKSNGTANSRTNPTARVVRRVRI